MTRTLRIGALLLFPIVCLGCSNRTVATVPVVIRQGVPTYLTQQTPEPVWNGTTNSDLIEHIFDLRQSLKSCNADKAAIAGIRDMRDRGK